MYEKVSAYEIGQIAIGMEEDGFKFYEKAAQFARNEKTRAIFLKLANDELEHKDEFSEKEFAKYFGDVTDTVLEMDKYIKDMFKSRVFPSIETAEEYTEKIKSDVDAVKLGMEQEARAIKFYTELERIAEHEGAKKAIHELVEEEKKHLKILSELLEDIQ